MFILLVHIQPEMLASTSRSEIATSAKIFRKETCRPLTLYQKRINEEAGNLAVENPSLLMQRGKLLEQARDVVVLSGYQFKKGTSRSKTFRSPESEDSEERENVKRPKTSSESRKRRIDALEADIVSLNERLLFKDKRRQLAEESRNYKLCDEIVQEMMDVTEQKRLKESELAIYRRKEKQSMWYQKKKSRAHSGSCDDSSSDIPQCSTSSSDCSNVFPTALSTTTESSLPAPSATPMLSFNQFLPNSLPVQNK